MKKAFVEFTQSRTRTITVTLEDHEGRKEAEEKANKVLDAMEDPFRSIEECECASIELTNVQMEIPEEQA